MAHVAIMFPSSAISLIVHKPDRACVSYSARDWSSIWSRSNLLVYQRVIYLFSYFEIHIIKGSRAVRLAQQEKTIYSNNNNNNNLAWIYCPVDHKFNFLGVNSFSWKIRTKHRKASFSTVRWPSPSQLECRI
jgi:hypothetical protein